MRIVPIGVVLALALTPASAAAQYLDPGFGSMVVQIIVAAVVGIGAVGRVYWHKIKAAFSWFRKQTGD
jgi:hypothetical protein